MASPRICSNCQQPNLDDEPYALVTPNADEFHFCSLSCLNEWVWAQREKQPKLSKSRQF